MSNVFSVEELLMMNEMMLGRGMPVQHDGIGYNKADYGACANYWYGLSDAQVADLAKRLVKYSNTQLHIDREIMKDTANYYMMKVTGEFDRTDGVSVNVTENGTLISFRYNELFIEIIKQQPKRQYDAENKQWIVPNSNVVKVLEALGEVGADVRNALAYVENHPLIKDAENNNKIDVLIKVNDNDVFMKFEYNKDIVDEIRKLDKSDRKWNAEYKYWAIKKDKVKDLMESIMDIANFKKI